MIDDYKSLDDELLSRYQKVVRPWSVKFIMCLCKSIGETIIYAMLIPRMWFSALFYLVGYQLNSSSCIIYRNVRYSKNRSRNIMDIYMPNRREETRDNPVMVFIHGGGWSAGFKTQYVCLGRRLALHGITTVIANYTLYPQGRIEQQVEDIDELIKYIGNNITKYGGNVDDITLMGHSAGAHITSLYLATKYDPKNVAIKNYIGIAGIFDVPDHFIHQAKMAFEKKSDMTRCCNGPTGFKKASTTYQLLQHPDKSVDLPSMYFLHGNKDTVVSMDQPIGLCKVIQQKSKSHTQVLQYDGMNHFDIIILLQDQDTANPLCEPFSNECGSVTKRHKLFQLKIMISNQIDHHKNEAATFSSEHDHEDLESKMEITVGQIVIRSDFSNVSAQEQAKIILERFNAGIKNSAFTDNPALGRALDRVDVSYFAMGHRNQVAELLDPRGQRFALTLTPDPTVTIKYLGEVAKTAHYFGSYGKHVLNVPAGHYAKAFSKNRPILYGEGPHVIIDPTFEFNEGSGFISSNEPVIEHQTINILRIPAGKVAKVWLGTQPVILESRRDPYVFVDAQFRLVSPDGGKKTGMFYNSIDTYIEHGSIKRIIPHTGEVAITYNNGILTVIPPPKDGKPVIINSATHNFDGFISTSLQTCLFPSKETKQQAMDDNKNNKSVNSDEINLKIFQTRDSLRVGVVLIVAFKIVDPELAVTKLGKEGILPHIENVSFADMGKAIQLSTLQEVMYFNNTKPGAANAEETQLQTIQDRVKTNLAKDLSEYGIELARLQIETMKVLDEEIAKKLAGQSVTTAEYTTKQATLVKEYDIKTTEAKLKAETDNIALVQKNNAIIAEAQAKLQSAQREAEALLIAADAARKAQEMKGELYSKYPQLLELKMAKIKAKALNSATIYITPDNVGNFMSSPLVFFDRVNAASNPKKTIEEKK
ncbi:hypothetical protein PPL_04262 [Heterostelium album PN500]|uniref:Uncharacterized protein n=1 Tax=Heterostelium pallidum (strain ATCC 26659 / Pp 5 / PN500) TaxID=670386 RepID=D3B730_HETP5|nr:hypothetical protein PPL_04262 [Heterostelium album PN500]EFA82573.1 hypothetical protein PPL_04262 [Heterostelium album PN500]|eukprot:XP_020434690.1 hypothetical protein PPL_04262 [Heterostelium album PN500]